MNPNGFMRPTRFPRSLSDLFRESDEEDGSDRRDEAPFGRSKQASHDAAIRKNHPVPTGCPQNNEYCK